MQKRLLLPGLLALLLIVAGCDQASLTGGVSDENPAARAEQQPTAQQTTHKAEVIPGQYIVVFSDGVSGIAEQAQNLTARHDGELGHVYRHALKGFSARISAQAAEALQQNPVVRYVEQDQVVHAIGTQSNATWGLDRSDQRDLPLDDTYTFNATGSGVTAYVIDTGIRTSHSDFEGRASAGYDAVGDGQEGQDCNGHGTHVAGTVGGGTWGIAKNVDLVAVRVLNCEGSGTTSGVIAGVDWVTANAQKPAVANMSLGGSSNSSLDEAVQNSIADGIQYALAAGNGNFIGREADACNYSPARIPEAMTISATDNADTKPSWANYGDCVDWFAPGVDITSAWIDSDNASNTISGTSMAAPHAAGAAALYLEASSDATPQQVRDALYERTTKSIVSDARTANNHLLYTRSIGSDDGTTNQPPTADFSYTTSDLTAEFTDQSTDEDGSIASWNWDFGDGATSTAQNPSHTYGAEGTFTVTLAVTDDEGATSQTQQDITVSSSSDGGTTITLTATGSKERGRHVIDLDWSGASSDQVDIYRNGSVLTTTANTGSYTDRTDNTGKGTYSYQVCEAGTSTCSAEETVTY